MTNGDFIANSHKEVDMVGTCRPFSVSGLAVDSCKERRAYAIESQDADVAKCIPCEGLILVRKSIGKGSSILRTNKEIAEARLERIADKKAKEEAEKMADTRKCSRCVYREIKLGNASCCTNKEEYLAKEDGSCSNKAYNYNYTKRGV